MGEDDNINETKIVISNEDKQKHFDWCWDKTIDSFNLENIGFIKMDVEENELFVLKGALNTLKQSNYPTILFESNNSNEELFSFLKNLNYKIIQISGCSNMFLASI